jgi:hypothetical protein
MARCSSYAKPARLSTRVVVRLRLRARWVD